MATDLRARLAQIQTFPQLVAFLRDEMRWPIESDDFEELTFDYTPEELGIDRENAAKIQEIKRLRPLNANQPWGIFFVKFEPRKLPVVALRRILSRVALKKRASANPADRAAWNADDLLFISSYGAGDDRNITFAHFSQDESKADLPTLKVLGWDDQDTALHLDDVAETLKTQLGWPQDSRDIAGWRKSWRSAFTLRHGEVITTSKALAVRLAELARAIRSRILTVLAVETDDGELRKLQKAFREALIHDLDGKGFADMYAQTIAYGLLSARVTDPKANTADGFAGQLPVTNPFLKELMETFLHVGGRKRKAERHGGLDFDELGVSEVVDLLDDPNTRMEAVVRDFGDRNPEQDPVIYFYELFLREYDKKQKMERGVFYTPRPVVSFIVRSVDEMLRTEFGLADGLADTTTWGEIVARSVDLKVPEGIHLDQDFVQILDPACGTGTFLVEVIDVIHKTMVLKWKAAGHNEAHRLDLWNAYVPQHLLPRLHGYELLMAPYAIAHLKVGLRLLETGYRFESSERARIYLTNALEPPAGDELQHRLEGVFLALAREANAVDAIKQKGRFTVVVGNPPYSDASQNLGPQFERLIERFRFYQRERIRERGAIRFEHVINNDYVKFWGLSLRLIEEAAVGTACLITSNTFLEGRSFRGVRDAMRLATESVRITDLHGEGWAGHLAREGNEDRNVFEIQTGVAVCQLTRTTGPKGRVVEYGELVGSYASKATRLLSISIPVEYEAVALDRRSYGSFLPVRSHRHDEYWNFPQLDSFFYDSVDGIKTSRDGLVVSNSRKGCIDKIRSFVSNRVSAAQVRATFHFDSGNLNLDQVRKSVGATFDSSRVHKFAYRPFDIRYLYYDSDLVFSHRMNKMPRILGEGTEAIVCASRLSSKGFGHALSARTLCSNKYSSHDINSRMFFVVSLGSSLEGGQLQCGIRPEFLNEANVPQMGQQAERAKLFARYVLAVLSAPSYRERYVEDIHQDFPRVPLPASQELLTELAAIGASISAAHCLALAGC